MTTAYRIIFFSFLMMLYSCTKSLNSFFFYRTANRFQFVLKSTIVDPQLGVTRNKLTIELNDAIKKTFAEMNNSTAEAIVLPASNKGVGDYQSNAALILSKQLKMKPNIIAEKIQESLKISNEFQIEISGPGFINFVLSEEFIKERLINMLCDIERLGVPPLPYPERVVVDFSSPNIAKEMHVGHLRSTIIGDTLSRVLEFLGYDVLRINHVGDWGTQFGMLIHYLATYYPEQYKRLCDNNSVDECDVGIGDLVEFYKASKKVFDEDANFKEASKAEVVRLQNGDQNTLKAWKAICSLSRREFQVIYDMLNIKVVERGESFYNPMLEGIVTELSEKGYAVDSEGAKCIFLPGYFNLDGSPLPFMIRKSDGGYLYASTDLAALKHRVTIENASRIIYVTDAGQAQHFKMLFEASRITNFIPENIQLTHVPFGVVQGEDGKKFKSRSGDTVKLKDLLNEAIRLAETDMVLRKTNNSELATTSGDITVDTSILSDEEKHIARVIGLGAVKYADLSMNRESNYRFSYKKMLSLSGNTAPYMLYAYVRIQGIKRKALETLGSLFDVSSLKMNDLILKTPQEIALSKQLIQWDETIQAVANDLYPNRLSQKFNQFYENCPVLKADNPQEQISRAALCVITSNVLKKSLDLLGIETVDKI